MNHTITMTPDEVADVLAKHFAQRGWEATNVTFDLSSTAAAAFVWLAGVRVDVQIAEKHQKRSKR